MWSLKEVSEVEVDEITIEIFDKYKYALDYIGVNFSRADVQLAIMNCVFGMEAALQATITYWYYLQNNNQKLEYPSAFLIEALSNNWQPKNWKEEYLDNPNFKSPCLRWWDEAANVWGRDVRNSLIADVSEDEYGHERILFRSGEKLSLRIAKRWGWQKVLEYAEDVNAPF